MRGTFGVLVIFCSRSGWWLHKYVHFVKIQLGWVLVICVLFYRLYFDRIFLKYVRQNFPVVLAQEGSCLLILPFLLLTSSPEASAGKRAAAIQDRPCSSHATGHHQGRCARLQLFGG